MKILVIGSGGREHAIAWRLAQSARISKIYVSPGNAGTSSEKGIENVPLYETDDLINFAISKKVDMTIVGRL